MMGKKKALLNPRAICGCKLLLVSKPSYAFLFKTFNNVCSRFAIYPVSESRESFPYFFSLSEPRRGGRPHLSRVCGGV